MLTTSERDTVREMEAWTTPRQNFSESRRPPVSNSGWARAVAPRMNHPLPGVIHSLPPTTPDGGGATYESPSLRLRLVRLFWPPVSYSTRFHGPATIFMSAFRHTCFCPRSTLKRFLASRELYHTFPWPNSQFYVSDLPPSF
jgi:hypothetical protein